jgi:hypothetical protein
LRRGFVEGLDRSALRSSPFSCPRRKIPSA